MSSTAFDYNERRSQLSGTAPPSFTASWLEELASIKDPKEKAEHEYAIRNVGAIAYAAGYETVRVFPCPAQMLKHATSDLFSLELLLPCDGSASRCANQSAG